MTSVVEQLSSYRDVLHFSSFRKLLIGQGLSMAGDALCLAALPLAMLHSGFSGETFGFAMAAVGIGTVVGAIAGGVLADSGSPKPVLIATDIARGLVQVIVASLMVAGAPSWTLILAYLVFGVGIGVSRPCMQVLLASLLPRHAMAAGNGAMNFADNFVAVVFPATLGVLIIIWEPVWGVLIDGITFACAALLTALLPDSGKLQAGGGVTIRDALSGVSVIARDRELSLGFVSTLILNVLCFPVFLVVSPYAVSDRFTESMWGICLAASGVGACVGSVVAVLAAAHRHLKALALTCCLLLCGAMALLSAGEFAWVAVLGAALVGVVEASWLTGWATAMQTLSPEKDLGKVVAMDTLLTSGAHPFIYLGSGLVGEIIGYSHALAITAAICAMGTLAVALCAVKR
jgi:predicted MFS family arabinose efflux permease